MSDRPVLASQIAVNNQRFEEEQDFLATSRAFYRQAVTSLEAEQNALEGADSLTRHFLKIADKGYITSKSALPTLGTSLFRAGNTLIALGSFRRQAHEGSVKEFLTPLGNFLDYDFQETIEMKNTLDKLRSEYDKLSHHFSFDGAGPHPVPEVRHAERELELFAEEFAAKLNTQNHNKELKFLRYIHNYLKVLFKYYQNAWRLFSNLEGFIEEIEQTIQAKGKGAENMEGHLFRKKKGQWQRFWFVLKDGYLYCHGKKDFSPDQALPIMLCSVKGHIPKKKKKKTKEEDAILRQHCFEIIPSGKKMKPIVYQADSEEEKDAWMKALQLAIEECINNPSVMSQVTQPSTLSSFNALHTANTHMPPHTSPTLMTSSTLPNMSLSSTGGVEALSLRPASKFRERRSQRLSKHYSELSLNRYFLKALKEEEGQGLDDEEGLNGEQEGGENGHSIIQEDANEAATIRNTLANTPSNPMMGSPPLRRDILPLLRRVPGNKFCADCSAKEPDWASISLGVLICLECSGCHRALGTHISKVRSVTLDKWEPEMVAFMQAVGNTRANSIFEATPPTKQAPLSPLFKKILPSSSSLGPVAVHKPDGTGKVDREARQRFIYAKYVTKEFLPKASLTQDQLNARLFELVSQPSIDVMMGPEGVVPIMKALATGANPNYQHSQTWFLTPLIRAVIRNLPLVVELLLQNGADRTAATPMIDMPVGSPVFHGGPDANLSSVGLGFGTEPGRPLGRALATRNVSSSIDSASPAPLRIQIKPRTASQPTPISRSADSSPVENRKDEQKASTEPEPEPDGSSDDTVLESDANILDKRGWTAFHFAAYYNREHVAHILVRHERSAGSVAKLEVLYDANGITPFDLAQSPTMLAILRGEDRDRKL
eukprot:TRINITY_DN3311_c0_g1_i5.p1 TRINITY_DN3311_c0_g1~~TRINITY_DN3311_c0_g1_i5.p1  ORF type:complete len:905 (-),score=202.97 TRINITY_DN3311_c0_g1_i5:44-2698(-)